MFTVEARVIEEIFLLFCYDIIFVIGVVGNGWLIFSKGRKNLRHSDDLYMMCLAAADLSRSIVGLSTILARIPDIDFSTRTSILYCFSFVDYSAFLVSSWLLVVLIVDRYRSITVPEENRRISRPKQIIGLFVMCCAAGIFTAIGIIFFVQQVPPLIMHIWLAAYYIYGWVVPFVFFFVCLGITIKNMQGNYLRHADGTDMEMLSRNRAANKRALFMIIIIAVQFFVLTLPTTIFRVVALAVPTFMFSRTLFIAWPWLVCLSFFNGCIKPIVYAVMRPTIEAGPCRNAPEVFQPHPNIPLIEDDVAAESLL